MSHQLHCYAYVEAPFDLVTRLLAEDARRVLQRATDDAAERAGSLVRTLQSDLGGFTVSKKVVIDVGEFEPKGVARSAVTLSWRAEAHALLFPRLDAELEVAAVTVDPPLTQITLDGTYEPPLGAVGAGIDRVALGRLAEATVHRFTYEIADRVRQLVDELPDDERI